MVFAIKEKARFNNSAIGTVGNSILVKGLGLLCKGEV